MSEWGIPFHVIEREWTHDQLIMMATRLTERLRKGPGQHAQGQPHGSSGFKSAIPGAVPYEAWARQTGAFLKHGD